VAVFSNVRFRFCSMRGRPHHRPGMVGESRNEAHRSIDDCCCCCAVIFSGKWVDFLGRKKRGENGCARCCKSLVYSVRRNKPYDIIGHVVVVRAHHLPLLSRASKLQ
jgi:hypothetical protein